MSKTLSNVELGVLKMAARHSVDGTCTLDAALLVALCDEILEYRKAAASNVESEKPEVVEEPFVGPTWGAISLVQLEKARKDYAAGEPKCNAGFAAQSLESEVRYLKEKLKQAENDRDFALDALADIAKGMELCSPYPAATKRIVLAEYERLKKATQIPCGMGEVRND